MKPIKILLIVLLCFFSFSLPVFALNLEQGQQLFEVHCAGCHPQGGNILRRGKNLRQKALKRYQMDNAEAIINLVTKGKNNMSAFSDRLSPEEIETVTAYVLAQAAKNWQ
jgi:cytochrome c6